MIIVKLLRQLPLSQRLKSSLAAQSAAKISMIKPPAYLAGIFSIKNALVNGSDSTISAPFADMNFLPTIPSTREEKLPNNLPKIIPQLTLLLLQDNEKSIFK